MFVQAQCKGHQVTGLRVGAANARRYFPRDIAAIELQLDHLRIECRLSPDFWEGQPEIHDPRLCLWLTSKQLNGNTWRLPVYLAMIRVGENAFRLEPASWKHPSRIRHAADTVLPRRAA
jgi:hypothetical protein